MFFCFWGTLFLVRNMRNTKYDKIADHHKAKENRLGHFLAAFLSGGVVGASGAGKNYGGGGRPGFFGVSDFEIGHDVGAAAGVFGV